MRATLFVAASVVADLEAILSLTWNRFYFQVGIPVFRGGRKVAVRYIVPPMRILQEGVPDSRCPTLVFKNPGGNRYDLRETVVEAWRTEVQRRILGERSSIDAPRHRAT